MNMDEAKRKVMNIFCQDCIKDGGCAKELHYIDFSNNRPCPYKLKIRRLKREGKANQS